MHDGFGVVLILRKLYTFQETCFFQDNGLFPVIIDFSKRKLETLKIRLQFKIQ